MNLWIDKRTDDLNDPSIEIYTCSRRVFKIPKNYRPIGDLKMTKNGNMNLFPRINGKTADKKGQF